MRETDRHLCRSRRLALEIISAKFFLLVMRKGESNMRRFPAILTLLAALTGCSTVSQMAATGGSRADGVVRLSYEYGAFNKVSIDEATALETARQRCHTWGYKDAEAFGGVTRQCNGSNMYGCVHWVVTKEYQCTGANTPT